MPSTNAMFVAADYVVMIGMVAVTMGIGIYYAIKDRKNNDTKTYNFGGKTMSPIPVGFSAAVSFISGVTVIGFPTDMYYFGTVTIWYAIQSIFPCIISCVYFIPLVFRLQISSIFEYLELRFHARNRILASLSEILKTLFYLGTAVYLPAIALNAVAPISVGASMAMISMLCTTYTALGGLKAVIWTDTLQSMIMLTGSLATSIQLTILVGGFGNIYSALKSGERLNAFRMDLDPTIQRTFWTMVIGQSFGALTYVTFSQTTMQRYLSCKSVSKARQAAWLTNFPYFFFMGLGLYSGAAMYAFYEGCDPVRSGQVVKKDQLISLTVGKIFQHLPGMNGLFVSAVFGASLSTVSSGINSIALLIVEDFILPFYANVAGKKKLFLCKILAVLIGVLVMGLGFAVDTLGATIVVILTALFGATGGPMVAVFTLGAFFPWCNSIGAYFGQIVGTIIGMWAALSATFYEIPPEKLGSLSTSLEKCDTGLFNATFLNQSTIPAFNFTTFSTTTIQSPGFKEITYPIWGISFGYIVILGFLVTFFVGIFVSFCTEMNDPKESNPDYFIPFFDNPCLPLKFRKFFRFGVPQRLDKKSKIKDEEAEIMFVAEEKKI